MKLKEEIYRTSEIREKKNRLFIGGRKG